ncbi:ATP-binding protein [Paraburkholderia terrae]|uniref:ATP-binding protein n=1 Tax=Paraburkholderia terrae TaxID=311230 RepID=UPI00296B14AA|nr:ATP-binding protein [Paraburkholderia terrae]MDW3662553.1 ATP-binding protein [Paraburkholderia terrae]
MAKAKEERIQIPLNVPGDPILGYCMLAVKAKYHDPAIELPEYRDNPTILALPAFDRKKILDSMRLGFATGYSESMRRNRKELRMAAIARVSRVWVLLPVHIQILDWIHMGLRGRYVGLQSVDDIKREMQRIYNSIQRGSYKVFGGPQESHSECLPLFSLPGLGKTTAVKMVLRTLPMVIYHDEYKGRWLGIKQAVWVFVTCPHNGSVSQLLLGILEWFDLYLDTKYIEELGDRATSGDLIRKVVRVLGLHYTGVLIIDEIQNALKAADRTELIEFLTVMFNAKCCAFICLGTPIAEKLLPNYWLQRRVSSGGVLPKIVPFELGELWSVFAHSIIALDFQRNAFDEREANELIIKLYELSAGMPAIAKLIWRLTHYLGIYLEEISKEEANKMGIVIGKVTPDLMELAATNGLGLIEGMLDAIRRRDREKIAALTPLAEERVDEYLADSFVDEAARAALDESAAATEKPLAIVMMLLDLGVPQIDAEECAREAIAQLGDVSLKVLIRRAIALYEKSLASVEDEGSQSTDAGSETNGNPGDVDTTGRSAKRTSRQSKTSAKPPLP